MSLDMQWCRDCGTVQYPTRDACRACLSDALEMRMTDACGSVLCEAVIHRSLDPAMTAGCPLRLGMVALPVGVRVIAQLAPDAVVGADVTLHCSPAHPGAIFAHAVTSGENAATSTSPRTCGGTIGQGRA